MLALGYDPTFESDPPRLLRALGDLVPDDARGADMVSRAAALAVPRLLRDGRSADAYGLLVDRAGMRDDVAAWVVRTWAEAVSVTLPAADTWLPPTALPTPAPSPPPPEATAPALPDEIPSAGPTHPAEPAVLVRAVPAGPDRIVVGAGSSAGLYVTLCDFGAPLVGEWRSLASPQSPLSRDLVLIPDGHGAKAVWTDKTGVHESSIQFDPAASSPTQGWHIGSSSLLLQGGTNQPRYPLLCSASHGGDVLDIVTTSDRQTLTRVTVHRRGAPSRPVLLPPPCHGQERLVALDMARSSDRDARLVALTDRSRVLISKWDVDVDQYSSWSSAVAPVSGFAAVTLLHCGDRLTLFTASSQGRVFCVDIAGTTADSWPWRSLGSPLKATGQARCTSLASVSCGPEAGRLLLVADGQVMVVPVDFRSGHARLGLPSSFPLRLPKVVV